MLTKIVKPYVYRNFSVSRTFRNLENVKTPQKTPSTTSSGPTETGSDRNIHFTFTPTEFQKTILVWSGKYKSKSEVPPEITPEILGRAQSKVRIIGSNILMGVVLIGCAVSVILGKNKAGRGESVEKSIRAEVERLKKEHTKESSL